MGLAAGGAGASVIADMARRDSTIERLESAADAPTGIHFVGASMTTGGQPTFVSWRQLHDEARAVGAALQARGLGPGDHVAILGPTSRGLITAIRGCWMAGIASMVLPLPMRMGSLDEFVESTRARIRHGDAKLVLIDDQLAGFYAPAPGDPPIEPIGAVLPGAPGVPDRRPAGDPGARSRAARHPAVHERVDERAEGRDDPRPRAVGQRRRVLRGRRHRRGDRDPRLVAAAVPRHGPSRLPGHPDDDRRHARAGRAAGLHGPSRQLDAVDLGLPRHGDGRPQLLVGAGHAGAEADARPRPVVAHAGAVRRRAGRSRRRRGVRRRRRAVRLPGRRRVPGLRHGRGGDRWLVPATRSRPGVRHRRSHRPRA